MVWPQAVLSSSASWMTEAVSWPFSFLYSPYADAFLLMASFFRPPPSFFSHPLLQVNSPPQVPLPPNPALRWLVFLFPSSPSSFLLRWFSFFFGYLAVGLFYCWAAETWSFSPFEAPSSTRAALTSKDATSFSGLFFLVNGGFFFFPFFLYFSLARSPFLPFVDFFSGTEAPVFSITQVLYGRSTVFRRSLLPGFFFRLYSVRVASAFSFFSHFLRQGRSFSFGRVPSGAFSLRNIALFPNPGDSCTARSDMPRLSSSFSLFFLPHKWPRSLHPLH